MRFELNTLFEIRRMVINCKVHVCSMLADLDTMMGATAEVGCTEFGDLPFGACEDPVR